MKKWAVWAALLMAAAVVVCAPGASAQGALCKDRIQAVDGRAMGGQTITVCAYSSGSYALVGNVWTYTGSVPCSPAATVYADPALTQAITPPLKTDSQGIFAYALKFIDRDTSGQNSN